MNTPTSIVAVATFVVYAGLVLLLGILSQRLRSGKSSFVGEYFLGSRGLGTLTFAMTFAATSASAGTFAGLPSLCYLHGWSMLAFIAGIMVGTLLVVGGLGKRMNQVARRAGAVTIPEVIQKRFASPACGLFATIVVAVMLTLYLVPQFKLGALIVQELVGESTPFRKLADPFAHLVYDWLPVGVSPDYVLCLGLFTFTVLPYVAFGGFRAVVWTDVMQGFVMVIGIAGLLILALGRLGNFDSATERMAHLQPPRIARLVFPAQENQSQRLRVPAGTWLLINDNSEERLFRTNGDAIVAPGEDSRPTRAVEIMTPEEKSRLRETLAEELQSAKSLYPVPRIKSADDYAFQEPGAYVTLPGPHQQNAAGMLPLAVMISFLLYYPAASMGQPGDLVRLMAFNSSRSLKRAIPLLATVTALIYIPVLMAFISSRLIEPGLDADPDRIMPTLVKNLCSGSGHYWLTGLLFAAPFAAAMSTVDSFILIVTASLVRDIYQDRFDPNASESRMKWLSYSCTLLIGLVVTAVALNPPRLLLMLIVFVGAGLTATFTMPVAISLYWRRMTGTGCLSGMSLGLATHIGLHVPGMLQGKGIDPIRILGLEPVIWAIAVSGLACVAGSLLSPPPRRDLIDKFFAEPASPGRN